MFSFDISFVKCQNDEAKLKLKIKPEKILINDGESASFQCYIEGQFLEDISWLINDELMVNGKIEMYYDTLEIIETTLEMNEAEIKCKAENYTESSAAYLYVSKKHYLFITKGPYPNGAKFDSSVSLKCNVNSTEEYTVSWYKDNSEITLNDNRFSIGENQSLNIENLIYEKDSGLYECRVNTSHHEAKNLVNFHVKGEKPTFINQIPDIFYVYDDPIDVDAIDCSATGVPDPKISWLHVRIQFFNALAIYGKKKLSFQLWYLSFTMGSLTSLSI